MKKHFFTGLAILLPIVLTLLIVLFMINVLTKPFLGTVTTAFDYYGIFNESFLFWSGPTALMVSSKVAIIIFFILFTLLLGLIGQLVLVKYLGRAGDYILHRIPVVNKIYKAIQDVVHTLVDQKRQTTFSKVVLVPFPHSKMHSLGLITNENVGEGSDPEYHGRISVFVPGTPNPAMGFMIMFREDQLITLDIGVDEALKFLVSCGVIFPETAVMTGIQQDVSAK